jgi:RNA polymerase sigma factor (sigma-70 family)
MDLDAAVRDLAPRLLGYCFLRTGDRGLAEDIAQESLTALVGRWRRHGPPDSPAAFAFAVARRRAWRATLRRRLWVPLEKIARKSSPAVDPEASLVQRVERRRVLGALTGLPSADREALLLTSVAGLGANDAAAALGIGVSAFKMRTLRARQRLRALLEESGDGPR